MNRLTETIIREHLVRKTAKQKAAFREALIRGLAEMDVTVHEEGTPKNVFSSVNVVAGDADRAEMIFGAHYDTCPRMPLPNFITPRSWLLFILYQLLLAVVIVLAASAVAFPFGRFISPGAGMAVSLIMYFLLLALMLKGPANPTTMNDNTSGVAALIEIMFQMPPEARSRCAFVFFDNEEVGLLGSSAFRKKHGNRLQTVPMINIDCIGDGDTLLLAAAKAFREDEPLRRALENAFEERGPVLSVNQESTAYPSDQAGFKKSLAVAALKQSRLFGYYMDRIHTSRDTVLRADNLARVAEGFCRMTREYFDSPKQNR